MPKQRLTDRQLISGVTLSDLLHFVVTGDTSQNPAGSSYKGNVEQLFDAFSAYTCANPLTLDVVNACTTGITINGNVIINGSATTINTEVIQSKDNNIVLNYSGTHLTAIGGGITLEDGQSNGVDSRIYTDSNGTWLFDPGLSASTGTIDDFTANTISVTTIGNSGDCVNDLYVSNIHSCSPLNINPLDEGNIYFGSTSGVTIDVINSRLGIGITTPDRRLVVSGDYATFYVDTDRQDPLSLTQPGERVLFVGNPSGRTTISISTETNVGVSIGQVGSLATNPNLGIFGNPYDSFIYSNSNANNLNIITSNGGGKEDSIRFYAKLLGNVSANTSSLHIQGSGSTKGYIGINNDNPTYRLDILGTTGRVFYDGDTTRNTYRQSQIINRGPSTGITAISIVSEGEQNELALLSIGSGVSNSIGWRFAGEPGDVALYASGAANNLNIMNNLGSGTTDNIRFYVGGSGHITGQTPSMIILGSGSTKGNVGIGTTTPTEVLDVSGNTKISEDLFVGDTIYVGNVTGTPTTNASLYIRQPSITGSSESPIIDIQIDDANSYFRINNATTADGFFTPTINTRQSDSPDRLSFYLDSIVDSTYDTPGATDVMRFRARRDSDFIQNRDLFSWYNYTTRLMDMDKDGNLDIIQGGLRINTLGTGTSVNNLGIDSSGNVVTGTTTIDTNIANTNLTLNGSRFHDLNGFDLTIAGGNAGIYLDESTNTSQLGQGSNYIDINNTSITHFWGLGNRLSMIAGETVINETGSNIDLRVESDTNPNMLFVDGGTNRVGIGTNLPSETLDVNGNTKISGSLNIGTVLGNTPIINLGLDSSGNVVTGTTGGGTFTGNTSGDCITDLYVTNLYGCSPLHIEPSGLNDVYLVENGGKVGIGTTSPNYQFVTTGSTGYFYYDGSEVRNAYRQSELAILGPSSGITNVSVKQFPTSGKTIELAMVVTGDETPNSTLWRVLGKSGDTSLYSSSGTQDLNIINATGSGTTDNINFFAGYIAPITNQTPDLHIHGSGSTKGYIGINNNNPQYTLDVTGEARISGSGQNILTIIGSGDTNPLFTIQGSSGELFSVTDSLVGSLFSVNDISGLPILEVFDDDTVHMGSYQAPSLNTTVRLTPSTGLSTVYSIPMSTYTGAWFEYTVKNTGGARAGQIMSIFSGNTVNFTETTTTDIGSTSDITFSMSSDGSNTSLQVSATTTGWEVKTIVRSI